MAMKEARHVAALAGGGAARKKPMGVGIAPHLAETKAMSRGIMRRALGQAHVWLCLRKSICGPIIAIAGAIDIVPGDDGSNI